MKVVYNGCFGGFTLSDEGKKLYAELAGTEYPGDYQVKRHDPVLVQVVETLGNAVSGRFSSLKVENIEGHLYRIEEYDGNEGVETPNSISWVNGSE